MASPRVLVIEADPALRDVPCAALESEGYRALPSDHAVAPRDVQRLRPAIVFLALMLHGEPAGHGWQEAGRAWPWTAPAPGPRSRGCTWWVRETAPPATPRS